jgi:antitoxin CcdA
MAVRPAKRAVNVSVSNELLEAARGHGISLSATLERAIAEELRTRQRSEWLAANAAAIDAYNRDVETHGTFGDAVLTF